MKSFARSLILAAAVAAMPALAAVQVKSAKFEDNLQVAGQNLVLNGAGVRVKIIVDVYAAGLYLPSKVSSEGKALNTAGAKSMQIVLLRELTGEKFAEAMIDGFKANNSDADIAKFQPKLDQLRNLMLTFGTVKEGTVIHMTSVPGVGLRVSVNGQQKGSEISGDDFYKAMLKIWLGEKPVDSDLKSALLGGN
ncbi:chalcone isomerase family protein [Aquabacterium sp.]|uniref:chalcone isomerase family protein n=1 Tax=Aquabacterium sp. TaxID=1872578 RepID=UPI002E32DC78|nr:chalcone isomerase family protein [Aquabacterium sp.]HEX5312630.1 chalcone isomerase family protein [Aquabacterium sp.]